MISVNSLKDIGKDVMVVTIFVIASTNVAVSGSFFDKEKKTAPSASQSTSTESIKQLDEAQVDPQPVPSPAPSERVEPVYRISEIPVADWKVLGIYIAQRVGIDKINRSFLSDWVVMTECSSLRQTNLDEFAMEELRSKARTALKSASSVRRVRIKLNTRLGEYDFDKQGFPLEPIKRNAIFRISSESRCSGRLTGRSNGGFPNPITVTMLEDGASFPGLPMESQSARALVAQMAGSRDITSDLVVDLVDVKQGGSPSDTPSTLIAKPVAMFLWRGDQFIGAVGQYDAGAVQPQQNQAKKVEEEGIDVLVPAKALDTQPVTSPLSLPSSDSAIITETVTKFYKFIEQKQVNNAIDLYSLERIPNIKRNVLEAVAKDTEYYKIERIEIKNNNGKNAEVLIILNHKKYKSIVEQWEINISLVKENGEWKIWSTPGKKIS